jgi:hypothetical protein
MKYKTLFTAHLCEETGAVIIDPAVNQEVRIGFPQTGNPQPSKPDYSRLIGKWVKCKDNRGLEDWEVGKYYPVTAIFPDGDPIIPSSLGLNDCPIGWGGANECFDLTDPRDTNPDEVERVIPFDLERWRSGDYVRVQVRDGAEVRQLTYFDYDGEFPFRGIVRGDIRVWRSTGIVSLNEKTNTDLTLVIKGGAE